MTAKRQKKLRERGARQHKLQQWQIGNTSLSRTDMNIQREADYIVGRAIENDSRCVGLGPLVFFSTPTGDAWMLDMEDNFAICLARDGVRQPARITETPTKTAVEWDRTFVIDGDAFTTIENASGRVTTVLEYPIQAILTMSQQANEAQG